MNGHPTVELVKRSELDGYELFVDRNHVPGVFEINAFRHDGISFILPLELRAGRLIVDGQEQN